MKIRLKQAWKAWPVGHVFTDMAPNVARTLIARGVGEDASEALAPKSLFSPIDRMMRSPATKRAR